MAFARRTSETGVYLDSYTKNNKSCCRPVASLYACRVSVMMAYFSEKTNLPHHVWVNTKLVPEIVLYWPLN